MVEQNKQPITIVISNYFPWPSTRTVATDRTNGQTDGRMREKEMLSVYYNDIIELYGQPIRIKSFILPCMWFCLLNILFGSGTKWQNTSSNTVNETGYSLVENMLEYRFVRNTPTWKSGKCGCRTNSYPVNQLLNNIPVKKREKKTQQKKKASAHRTMRIFFHRQTATGIFFRRHNIHKFDAQTDIYSIEIHNFLVSFTRFARCCLFAYWFPGEIVSFALSILVCTWIQG